MEGNSGDGRICHSFSLCTVARMAGLMWHNKSQNSLVRRAVGLERLNEAARVCSKHTHTHTQISLNGLMNSCFFSDVISRCGYTTKRLILLCTQAFFYFLQFHSMFNKTIEDPDRNSSTVIAIYFRKGLHARVWPPDDTLCLLTCSGKTRHLLLFSARWKICVRLQTYQYG